MIQLVLILIGILVLFQKRQLGTNHSTVQRCAEDSPIGVNVASFTPDGCRSTGSREGTFPCS